MLIVISIVGAFAAAIIAAGKNRNALAYAALGFFLPLIGVVAVWCLPPLPAGSCTASAHAGNCSCHPLVGA